MVVGSDKRAQKPGTAGESGPTEQLERDAVRDALTDVVDDAVGVLTATAGGRSP